MTAVIILGWENVFPGAFVFVNLPEGISRRCVALLTALLLQGCVNAQWRDQRPEVECEYVILCEHINRQSYSVNWDM